MVINMCGRFTISISNKELKDYLYDTFDIDDFEEDYDLPRYNVAPGQNILSITNNNGKNQINLMKWGFIPFFAKDENIGYKMINAKSETLDEKPSFKESFKNKRCIILANGFYEWEKNNNQKIPMRFIMNDESIFPMAGLWSSFKRNDGTVITTCTIITTTANQVVAPIHDRMPVILTNETNKIWLDSTITDYNLLKTILRPFDDKKMRSYKVSSIVNNAKNEIKDCINSI